MLVFLPPQCNFPLPGAAGKQTTLTSSRFLLPDWPSRLASSLVALHSLQANITPQPAVHKKQQQGQRSQPTNSMSSPHEYYAGSPRSPFSPTLNSIPEVFEYEPLDATPDAVTPMELQESAESFLPEPATTAVPRLSMARVKEGIILSPRKAMTARASRVANVLRNLLEADRIRRRRILRIYLKAIVFLKLLLKSHERYSTLVASSGVYMPR